MNIKYVGLKRDGETAFLRETGITWMPGTRANIPDAVAIKMLAHPDVFAVDDYAEDGDAQTKKRKPKAQQVIPGGA